MARRVGARGRPARDRAQQRVLSACLASFILVFVFERVRWEWVPFSVVVAAICAGLIIHGPETFHGFPLHALAAAIIVFLWLRLAANAFMPDDHGT